MLVAHHVRSGKVALNVVTAALSADARTREVPVRFAGNREQLVEALGAARTPAGQRYSPGPTICAWSFYSPDFLAAREDLAWVRERTSGVLHVAGGVHASAEPLATLRAGFDLAAVGEGESTIVELMHAAQTGAGVRAVPGLAYLDDSGRLVSRGPGERRPLDDFPAFNARDGKWNAIEITRGCVYACSFCQTPFMFKARFRHRSPANVRAHVAQMRAGGVRYVRFLTPTSLSYGSAGTEPNLAAVEELLAGVREELGPSGKIYFGTFPSEIRPEHVSPEALAIIRRHCDNRTLVIGGQSGSEQVLQRTRRGHSVEDVRRAVRLSVEAGFLPDVDFLFGLPEETEHDRRLSLELAKELVSSGARIHSHAFMPLPGTPLRDGAPEAIEPPIALELGRLESRGAMHGQWRKQVEVAAQLVALRVR